VPKVVRENTIKMARTRVLSSIFGTVNTRRHDGETLHILGQGSCAILECKASFEKSLNFKKKLKSPLIVLEKEWKALKILKFVSCLMT